MNVVMEFREMLSMLRYSNSSQFFLFGIFAGLMLSGVILDISVEALGIGCAVYAGNHLFWLFYFSIKSARLDKTHEERDR